MFTTHLYKSVPFAEKRPRRHEYGIKHGYEEMKHDFPQGTLSPEKQDYLFRRSIAAERFPLERHKKSPSIYFLKNNFPTGDSGNVL